MSAIEKERILRINCPGLGVESFFSTGCAKPLNEYEVIVVNPISGLHLFDKDPDLLKQIEAAQQDGMTSYLAKSDKLIQSVESDLEARKEELALFLARGGLLVYFLCPHFVVQGPGMVMDNYSWLDVLAPDNSNDKKNRHMSSASRGKNIEPTPEAQSGPFSAYLKQAGLEWTTIIRAEKLADGYSMLATAGPNKCIAAHLAAGDNGGRIVFLPAPYQTEFDAVLIQCINTWAQDKKRGAPLPAAPPPAAKQAEAAPPPPAPEPAAAYPDSPPPQAASPPPEQAPPQVASPPPEQAPPPQAASPPPDQAPPPAASPPADEASAQVEEAARPAAKEEPRAPAEPVAARKGEPAANRDNKRHAEESKAEPEKPREAAPKQPKDLMEKMEEITKPTFPEWCVDYSFSDLDQLREQLLELNEQVRLTQVKISEVEGRIETMEWLKNALLSGEGEELSRACTKVFETLGWRVESQSTNKSELFLMDGESTSAIVRVVRTTSQVKRSDLAQLAESVITYWGEHEQEPKGVLIASTWATRPPGERTDEDYTDALAEFAEKKNLCLMTTFQLLCIFRDVEGGYMSVEDLKETILTTSGRLDGFMLEPGLAAAAS